MGSYPHYEMPIPQVSNPRATAVTSVSNPMDKAMMKRLLELQALQEQLMHMVWDMKQGEMYQTKCIEAMQSTMDRMQSQLENMAERMTLQDRKLEGITNALVAIVAAYESSCKAVRYLSQHMQSMEKLLQHVFNNTQMDVQQQEPSHWSSTGRELLREFVALQGSNVAANIGNGNTVSQAIGEIDVDGNLHQRNDDSNQVIEPMDLSHPPTQVSTRIPVAARLATNGEEVSNANTNVTTTPTVVPTHVPSTPHAVTTETPVDVSTQRHRHHSPRFQEDHVSDFRPNRKHVSDYPVLTDNKDFYVWQQDMVIDLEAYGFGRVLGKSYDPPDASDMAELARMRNHVYLVLTNAVQTVTGKAIVESHRHDKDCQAIMSELMNDAYNSPSGRAQTMEMLSWLVTVRYQPSMGSSEEFCVDVQRKMRQYNARVSHDDKLTDRQMKTYMQQAFSEVPHFSDATMAEVKLTAITGHHVELEYEQWYKLHHHSCATYDVVQRSKPKQGSTMDDEEMDFWSGD